MGKGRPFLEFYRSPMQTKYRLPSPRQYWWLKHLPDYGWVRDILNSQPPPPEVIPIKGDPLEMDLTEIFVIGSVVVSAVGRLLMALTLAAAALIQLHYHFKADVPYESVYLLYSGLYLIQAMLNVYNCCFLLTNRFKAQLNNMAGKVIQHRFANTLLLAAHGVLFFLYCSQVNDTDIKTFAARGTFGFFVGDAIVYVFLLLLQTAYCTNNEDKEVEQDPLPLTQRSQLIVEDMTPAGCSHEVDEDNGSCNSVNTLGSDYEIVNLDSEMTESETEFIV